MARSTEYGFNEQKFVEICKASGSKSVRESSAYLRRAYHDNPDKMYCEIHDGVACFAGTICKKHFRLLEIAVREEEQGNGYGTLMLNRIKRLCIREGLTKITFRANANEPAVDWYLKHGGIVIGKKQDDYCMEIMV